MQAFRTEGFRFRSGGHAQIWFGSAASQLISRVWVQKQVMLALPLSMNSEEVTFAQRVRSSSRLTSSPDRCGWAAFTAGGQHTLCSIINIMIIMNIVIVIVVIFTAIGMVSIL